MKELNIGIIGYGGRLKNVSKMLRKFGIPMKIGAVADPRVHELSASNDEHLKGTKFYAGADSMLKNEKFDGIMVGTPCVLHTEMAIKAAKHKVPLFLEKPVSVNYEQLRRLEKAFKNFKAPTVVSFPLRLSPLVTRAKEIIAEGLIGTVENFNGFNDVPYGDCYFYGWGRIWESVGGLWLQKATHDLDYITYILEQKPVRIAAMNSRRIYKGDKPYELVCSKCKEAENCQESPYNFFYSRRVVDAERMNKAKLCVFSKGIKNEDSG
ncbi:MAG: Gfo/Idh/MocA family oxidoreductase, partial [Candidatus Firestonebacteria bacterium]